MVGVSPCTVPQLRRFCGIQSRRTLRAARQRVNDPAPGRSVALQQRADPPRSNLSPARFDHAEAVALGVFKDDEVGIVTVAVPVVDALSPEPDEPLDLSGLVARVEIQVMSRMVLHGRLTERERYLRARPFTRHQDHPGVVGLVSWHVVQRGHPEILRACQVVDTQHS